MQEMENHYIPGAEASRLSHGSGRLEWLRTIDVIERVLPPPPAVVLDVGGGPGAYALPLARRGYRTHLIDLIPLHVTEASEAASQQPDRPLASATVGDARQLSFEDASADAVLLLGPLYHLTETSDRMQALSEAHRVLRPGGVLVAAAISRYASMCDGLLQGYLNDPAFEAIVERDLSEGQHRNEMERPEWFTTAYFHKPADLANEVGRSGFELDTLVGVEGPAWLMSSLDDWLRTEETTSILLRALRRIEAEPDLLGASSHLIAVGYRR